MEELRVSVVESNRVAPDAWRVEKKGQAVDVVSYIR